MNTHKHDRRLFDNVLCRLIAMLLAAFTLLCCACTSGTKETADEEVFRYFMNALDQGQFVEAYSFLSEKIAVDNGEYNSQKSSNAITRKEFVERYESIFSLLGITSLDYTITGVSDGSKKRPVDYSIVYKTREIGELETNGTAEIVLENDAWKLSWTPSLIFSDMTWGDTIAYSKLSAKRGDILASGEAVAVNVNLVTVYSLLIEYDEENVLEQRIAERENLRDEALNELSKLTDWPQLTQEERDAKLDALVLKMAEERLQDYMKDYELFSTLCPEMIDSVASALSDAIGMEREEFDKRMTHVYGQEGSCTLAQFYPDDITADQMEALKQIPTIHVATENFGSARYYPYGSTLSHILGYVGSASQSDIEQLNDGREASDGLYTEDSIVGKSGIERLYETTLRGKDGYYYFIRSSDGQNKRTLFKKDKEDGLDVNLTIDLELQQYTEKLMELVIFGEETTGAVIVMNPKTGAIDAIASYPDFDLNKVTRSEKGYYASLLEDERRPLISRAVDGSYPPGSTFKAFVAAAALEQNVVNENYIFTGNIVNDYWTPTGYGRWIWPAIKRTRVFNRTEPNNMTNAMLHSDNIYFADIALKIGEERFISYMEKLGLGSKLPFELGSGRSQVIGKNSEMNYKMLADSGYGQGEVLSTPLQLATMFCAFANNGDIPTPYITDSLFQTVGVEYSCVQKTTPSAWIPNAISSNVVNRIVPMLEGVMDPDKNGTGRSLRVTDYTIAGKTGTAEFDTAKNRAISWFIGYREGVDSVDEERLVLVMLDVPYMDPYTSLKFNIARELLKADVIIDPNAQPTDEPNQ